MPQGAECAGFGTLPARRCAKDLISERNDPAVVGGSQAAERHAAVAEALFDLGESDAPGFRVGPLVKCVVVHVDVRPLPVDVCGPVADT